MIKIDLDDEKKQEIKKMFLEDLVGDENCSHRKGRFIEILERRDIYDLLQKEYGALCDYFYDDNGEVKIDQVKKLLLTDKKGMRKFMTEFGSYDCKKQKDRRLSDQLLGKVFRYDNLSKRKVVYNILKEMNVTVCPYCNRLYIVTLGKGRVRPQFDHYFPKSRYPYLALSLYNLIPSCNVCNMAKGDMDTQKNPILYPYEEEFGEEVVFYVDVGNEYDVVKFMRGDTDKFNVSIENPGHHLEKQVKNHDDRLHITDLYNEHKDYIRDIFRNYHINTDRRMQELLHTFPELFSSREELQGLIYMNDVRKENWGKRSLAKLTHDIYMELKNLSP